MNGFWHNDSYIEKNNDGLYVITKNGCELGTAKTKRDAETMIDDNNYTDAFYQRKFND